MTDRFIGPSGGKRRQRFWMLSSLVAVLALAFAVNGFAGPVGQAGGFEDETETSCPGTIRTVTELRLEQLRPGHVVAASGDDADATDGRQDPERLPVQGHRGLPQPRGNLGHHRRYLVRRRDEAGQQLREGGHRQAAEQG